MFIYLDLLSHKNFPPAAGEHLQPSAQVIRTDFTEGRLSS